MSLLLEIVGPQAAQLGAAARKTFMHEGGTIGRANVNDWVIPDAYVSGQHARVHYQEGRYFLEDISTNGVFIKNPGNRLPKGQHYPLQSGDRVFIDAYEIKVTIDGGDEAAPSAGGPSLFESIAKQNGAMSTAAIEKPGNSFARASEVNHGIPVDLTIPLPEPSDALADAIAGADIQVDFDPFGEQPESIAATAALAPPLSSKKTAKKTSKSLPIKMDGSQSAVNQAIDLRMLLAGAGVSDASITPELTEQFGRILQVAIAGIMELLHAREHIKQEFGIRTTTYKKADNNPLKFSVNVEDALHNLLVKRNLAYLGPVEAFEDAFRDLQNHETALLQAMRAGFNAMLQAFSPDGLQMNFNKEVKQGALWSGPIKLRYWELYRNHYKDLTKNPDQCFRELFADEFVRVYSAQLEQHKSK